MWKATLRSSPSPRRTRGEFLEQVAAGVDEELFGLAGRGGEHEGIVVADLLIPAVASGDAEDGRHVAAHFPFGGGDRRREVRVGHELT